MRLAWEPIWTRFSGQLGIGNHLSFVRDRNSSSFERGLENAWIGAAPAKVAGAGVFDLVGRGTRILFEQRSYAHDEAGRAKPAHQSILVNERLLDGREF